MKWTTVNDWKSAMTAKMRQAYSSGKFEPITLLEGKKTEDHLPCQMSLPENYNLH